APSNLLAGNVTPLPDFGGLSVESTRAALEGLGLIYQDGGPVPSAAPVGSVAGTDPAPGSRLSPGITGTVYTSDGSLYLDMPNLVGQDAAAAKNQLVGLNVAPSLISFEFLESPGDPLQWCKVAST